jgi:hypothetical protein
MAKKKKVSNIKRGRLSDEEKNLIRDWLEFKTDSEIAADLRRALPQVLEYKKVLLANSPAPLIRKSEAEQLKAELHARPEWKHIQSEFTDDELFFFENDYVELRRQFKQIVHTEFKQVRRLITVDILMHRHMTERKRSQEEIDRLEKLLRREYDKSPALQDIPLITQLETNLQANKAASSQKTKEYKDLEEKHQSIMKDLKGTRDQIVKNVDQRGRFIEVLKMLTDEDARKLVNEEVGLYKLSAEKETKRLGSLHTYRDNIVDRPFLTPETVNG